MRIVLHDTLECTGEALNCMYDMGTGVVSGQNGQLLEAQLCRCNITRSHNHLPFLRGKVRAPGSQRDLHRSR